MKGSSTTYRKHLEQVERHSGRKPPELEASKLVPAALEYLWHWFRELVWCSPLTYTELLNWAFLTRRDLTVFEVDMLMKLDKIYRSQNV